jgi:crossover junction endodeoxyribonuclease RuvC
LNYNLFNDSILEIRKSFQELLKKRKRVLGIDPGTIKMGFGIVEFENSRYFPVDGGILKFKSTNLQNILKELVVELNLLIEKYEIDEVAIETVFFAKNPKSIIKLSQFRGALLLYFLERDFNEISEYSPLEIKQSVTGNGKATKEQVNFMVKKLLGIREELKPLDVSDAFGVAITHIQRS